MRFQFRNDVTCSAVDASAVIDVPTGIDNKPQLMRELARLLSLPDYFGGNWDALDECLRDVLSDGDERFSNSTRRCVCLLHRDLPLAQDTQNCCDYLELLNDTLAWAEETPGVNFVVVFPTAAEGAIRRLADRHEET